MLSQSAYDSFTELSFDQTRKILQSKEDQNLHDVYLDNLNDCSDLILNRNKEDYRLFSNRFEQRIEQIESFPEQAAKGFYPAEIRVQWAFVAAKHGDHWTAFWTLRKAMLLIKKNRERYPDYELNLRTLGLLNVVLDIVPRNRQWMLTLFGMEGDFEEGYQQLTTTLRLEKQWSLESRLILSLIDAYILEQNVDYALLPDEPLFAYVKGLVSMKQQQAQKAISHFETLNERLSVTPYLLAEAHFMLGQYDDALKYYEQFLQKNHSQYRKDALIKSGLCYWFQDLPEQIAQDYFEKAKLEEESSTEIDRNASKILSELEEIRPQLLQLRYYLDGGAFEKAKELVKALSIIDMEEKEVLELTYRKARLYKLTGALTKAKIYFNEVTEEKKQTKRRLHPTLFFPTTGSHC